MSSETVHIPEEIVNEFKEFKMGKKKENYAIIFRINKDKLVIEKETELEQTNVQEISDTLPESSPRFVAFSYKYTHADGRVSFPLVFIFYCPTGINTSLNMLYASVKQRLCTDLQIMKAFDLRSLDTLTEAWLREQLAFYR